MVPTAVEARPGELASRALAEQRRRWQVGDRVRVEDLLRQHPALRDDPEGVLDLIYGEFVLCEQAGGRPTPQEYLERFPEHAETLRRQFQLHDAVAASAGPPPADARAVPGYEILECLGRGGMGVVYKARQLALDRVVALKMVLHAGHAGAADRERFRIEAGAVARLQHPNIVGVHEVGEHDGVPFLCLEFCAGGGLDRRLRGNPVSLAEAAALVETLARATHAAHRARIVHRDLKPANVLLVEGPDVPLGRCTPKISDFGLAKKLDGPAGPTRSGAVVGSPLYMAPEQARGDGPAVGPAADVYSLGAILYELLTGRPPFQAASVGLTLWQVLADEPVRVRAVQPRVPRDLETVCHKCLHKDPRRRYDTAEALAEDLRRFRAGEPVNARAAGPLERAARWVRRRPTVAALAAVGVLVLLGLLVSVPLVIARLQAVAREARADARAAQAVADRLRARADCERWLRQGEAVVRRPGAGAEDLKEARGLFASARDRIAEQDAAEDDYLRRLRSEADRQLDALGRRMRAWEDYRDVLRQRDRALFLLYGDAFTGTDRGGRWRDAARDAAREALDRHGWPDGLARAVARAPLEASEKETLRLGLYELCLILAEATAPRPGDLPGETRPRATEALRVLDRGAALAGGQRAVHLRRARYLTLRGEPGAASAERARAAAGEPRTGLDWFLEGCDRAFAEAQMPQALGCFNEALRLRPDLFWAHFFRAVVCQKLQNTPEAWASLTACALLQRDFPWTYLLRGSLAAQAGDFATSADDFARADKLLPAADPDGRYVLLVNRGFAALRQHDPRRAAADLEEAARLRPELYHAHVNLAEARALQQDYPRALEHLDRAVAIAGKGLEEVAAGRDRAVADAQRARLASLYRTRARMHLKRDDDAAALRDLDAAVRLAPPSASGGSPARDHHERALVLYRLRRYPEALSACRAALALSPDVPSAHQLLGEVQLALGDYREALAAFDRCWELETGKGDAEFFRQRGRARAGLHDPRGAAEEYTEALKRTEDAPTHAARGWAYLDAEAPRLALADFEEAIRRDPRQGDSFNGRGLARVRLGDYAGAADAERALRLGPESWRLRWHAARIFARAAELPDAGRPGSAPQLRERDRERAVACLRRALELHPRDGRAAWASGVLREPTFRLLRGSPGFRLLAAYASPRED
jgi:tetratricopeptide (TPR) repeat protein